MSAFNENQCMHEKLDEFGVVDDNCGEDFIEIIDEISWEDISGEQVVCILRKCFIQLRELFQFSGTFYSKPGAP